MAVGTTAATRSWSSNCRSVSVRKNAACGIVFRHEQPEAALLLVGESRGAAQRAIEFRIGGNERQQVLLEGESDFFGRDVFAAERGGELACQRRIIRKRCRDRGRVCR